jgi:small subunit ribosomal protein S5
MRISVEKAVNAAKKSLITLPLVNETIPHQLKVKYKSSVLSLMPAKPGTGVIAGGAARAVLELAGVKDIRTKSYGTNNRINMVKATLMGLKQLRSAEQVAKLRGKTVEEILG